MQGPGIEPGSTALKAAMLTIILPTHSQWRRAGWFFIIDMLARLRNGGKRYTIQVFPCSSVAECWSCKPKIMSSILIRGSYFKTLYSGERKSMKKTFRPQRDQNMQPSDLESDMLPLCHRVNICQVLSRFELGSLDSKFRVLTITPQDLMSYCYPLGQTVNIE